VVGPKVDCARNREASVGVSALVTSGTEEVVTAPEGCEPPPPQAASNASTTETLTAINRR
jgi:hypothetical protein